VLQSLIILSVHVLKKRLKVQQYFLYFNGYFIAKEGGGFEPVTNNYVPIITRRIGPLQTALLTTDNKKVDSIVSWHSNYTSTPHTLEFFCHNVESTSEYQNLKFVPFDEPDTFWSWHSNGLVFKVL
jgi:hypothetical protein